jgi:hypothetical protein
MLTFYIRPREYHARIRPCQTAIEAAIEAALETAIEAAKCTAWKIMIEIPLAFPAWM